MQARRALPCVLVVAILLATLGTAADDTQVAVLDRKYRHRDAVDVEKLLFGLDAGGAGATAPQCHFDVNVLWTTRLGAPLSAAPIIGTMRGDGRREIAAATTAHFVELLGADDGHAATGWPFMFGDAAFSASPLLHDVDGDGEQDVLVATENAELVVLHRSGVPFYNRTVRVRPLRLPREWWLDLAPQPAPAGAATVIAPGEAHPQSANMRKPLAVVGADVAAQADADQLAASGARSAADDVDEIRTRRGSITGVRTPLADGDPFGAIAGWLPPEGVESLRLFQAGDAVTAQLKSTGDAHDPLYAPDYERFVATLSRGRATQRGDDVWVDAHVLATPTLADLDGNGRTQAILSVSYYFADAVAAAAAGNVGSRKNYVACGLVAFELDTGALRFETMLDLSAQGSRSQAYATAQPVVADLDGDGRLEIVLGTGVGMLYVLNARGELDTRVGTSFPRLLDSIVAPVLVEDLRASGELNVVVADRNANVVCYGALGAELWEARAGGAVLDTPVAGDVDGDGELDVVVASADGSVWAFRGRSGTVLPHFPVRLRGTIVSHVLLLPLVHARTARQAGAAATRLADKPTTTTAASSAGMVGKIMASAADKVRDTVNWPAPPEAERMHLIVGTSAGLVYLVDGGTGCVDSLDLAEPVAAAVLASDLRGAGHTELLVATTEGALYALVLAGSKWNPLYAWESDLRGGSGGFGPGGSSGTVATCGLHQGIVILPESRVREVESSTMRLAFEIVDRSAVVRRQSGPSSDGGGAGSASEQYQVHVRIGGSLVWSGAFTEPGVHRVSLSCALEQVALVHVSVRVGRSGLWFSDVHSVAFNAHVHRLDKFLLAGPFLVAVFLIAFVRTQAQLANSRSAPGL